MLFIASHFHSLADSSFLNAVPSSEAFLAPRRGGIENQNPWVQVQPSHRRCCDFEQPLPSAPGVLACRTAELTEALEALM